MCRNIDEVKRAATRFSSRESLDKIQQLTKKYNSTYKLAIPKSTKRVTAMNLMPISPKMNAMSPNMMQINIYQGAGVKFEPLKFPNRTDTSQTKKNGNSLRSFLSN